MSNTAESCAIRIAVRERPVREFQKENSDSASVICYHSANPQILIVDERPFAFDNVLSPAVSQQQLFDDIIKPLVAKVLQGFNCTALAYGQTGTGKSYTMGLNLNSFEGENVGVIPRCLKELFTIDHNAEPQGIKRKINVAFIEIYNEKVYDLLAESSQDPIVARGYKYTGGIRKEISNIHDCYSILIQGTKNRHVRPTKLNSQSSRSHAMFTIHVQTVSKTETICASLNLVDLAGSEGVRRTGHQGVAMSEGVHINQGLLTIGKVMQAMTMGYKVIPYRDSVLSSVLQDSLNPNSYLTLLACISPHREDLSETLSTLRFAQNAKQLKHTPQINTILAEIKKNKVKTPHKSNTIPNKNGSFGATKTPNKRSYTIVASAPKSGLKNIGYHSNTFCTPSKIRRIESNKFNQTDIVTTSKAKQNTQAETSYRRPTEMRIAPLGMQKATNASDFNREYLFSNDTIDSRSSLFSLNISTSTAIEAPSSLSVTSSYSPVVRKCMSEFEKIMEVKMAKMMESLKAQDTRSNLTPHIDESLCSSSVAATPAQLIPNTIRLELTSIMQELLNRTANKPISVVAEESSQLKISPIKQDAKCKLFATSSPVFKVPDIPASSISAQMESLNASVDNSAYEELTNAFAHASEQTVRNKTMRRSKRISMRKHNDSNIGDESLSLQPQRQSNRLISIKEINDHRRRSIRLAKRVDTLDTTGDEDADSHERKPSSSNKKKKQTPMLKNSVIASYFENRSSSSPNMKFMNQNISKHKKAILDMLNTGSMKELQILPQVGQKTAYQIVTQRTLNGKFKSLTQVEKLPIWRGNAWERFAQANMLL